MIIHKDFLVQSYYCRPLSSFSPFSVLNLRPGPCHPQDLSWQVYLSTSACLCHPHVRSYPTVLNRQPSTLTAPRGLRCALLYPVPCASPSPSPCYMASLGVFWNLIFLCVSFCASLRGQGTSITWQYLAQSLAPALLGYNVDIQATPLPPLPVFLPPLLLVISPPLVEGSGAHR